MHNLSFMLYKNLLVAHCHHIIFNIFYLINHTKEYLFPWATMLPCVNICSRNTSHSESLVTEAPWTMSSSEYQGWKCVWILYEELEFSNSYFHLNICRGAAQFGFVSLFGIWHSPLWLVHHDISLFSPYIIVSPDLQTAALCVHLTMLFPHWLFSSHDKPFTVIILLLPE